MLFVIFSVGAVIDVVAAALLLLLFARVFNFYVACKLFDIFEKIYIIVVYKSHV